MSQHWQILLDGQYLNIIEWFRKVQMLMRHYLEPARHSTPGYSGPKDHQSKTDKFLSAYGVMYVMVNSWKNKCKDPKEHILNDIVPHSFDSRMEEIQEDHQQTIQELDNRIQAIQYESRLTWDCRCREMFIRLREKDVRIRYITSLLIVRYLAEIIQVKITLL